MTMAAKVEMDIEKLLQWAYRDELSKRQLSAAEGIWDRIFEDAQLGVERGRNHTAQRYAHFGLPDRDAEEIERQVGRLEDTVIDWAQSFDAVAGDLAGLITVNDMTRRKPDERVTQAGWGKSGDKALRAWWPSDESVGASYRPRDVLMVGGIPTKMLVTSHAIKGTRPDWREEPPEPHMIQAAKGPYAMVVGECRGKNLYTAGSHCPLRYEPSPMSIMASRADYLAWHSGLTILVASLELEKFVALPPKAPQLPWFDEEEESRIVPVMPTGRNSVRGWGTLPLKPSRGRAGAPRRTRKASEVRIVEIESAPVADS